MFECKEINIKKLEKIMEFLFKISLYVVIFLGHKTNGMIFMYYYRLFYVLTLVFGILFYILKKQKIKDMIKDLVYEVSIPIIGSILIAKITNIVDLSDMYEALYTIPIIILGYLMKRKRIYRVEGKNLFISNYEFLKLKIGSYALIPTSTIYIVPIILALIGVDTEKFIIILVGIEFIFNPLYIIVVDKLKKQKIT